MPLFRKNVEFKVTRTEKPQQAEETKQEPKPEPVPEQTEAKEPLDAAELEKLRDQWLKALQEHVARGYPNAIRLQQDGADRYFYTLQRLREKTEADVLVREFRCLRDDLLAFDIKQTLHRGPYGVAVDTEFQKLAPQKAGLDPNKIIQLVDQIVKGNIP